MPVIVFANSKGGAGKSTSAVLLATELSERGASVILIDADPNKPVSSWARHLDPTKNLADGKPKTEFVVSETLTVRGEITEDSIIDSIEDAASKSAFVIVDLEGTASLMVGFAISRANLVIVPTQGSHLDAKESNKTLKLVRAQERSLRMNIPAVVLMTKTSAAIKPRTLRAIINEFENTGVPVLKAQVHERDAYRAIFSFGLTLSKLDPSEVSGLRAARSNAKAYMTEVVNFLKSTSVPTRIKEVA